MLPSVIFSKFAKITNQSTYMFKYLVIAIHLCNIKCIQHRNVIYWVSNKLPGQQSLAGHSRQFVHQSAVAVLGPKGEDHGRWEVVKTEQKRGAK